MISISMASVIIKIAVEVLKKEKNRTNEVSLIIYGDKGAYAADMIRMRHGDGHVEYWNPVYFYEWRTDILPAIGRIVAVEVATDADTSVTFTDISARIDDNGEMTIMQYDSNPRYQFDRDICPVVTEALMSL